MIYKDKRIVKLNLNNTYCANLLKTDDLNLDEGVFNLQRTMLEYIYYDGCWYHIKPIYRIEFLYNELIGSYLMHKIGGRTVDYLIADDYGRNDVFYNIISKCYREKGYKYYGVSEFNGLKNDRAIYDRERKPFDDRRLKKLGSEQLKEDILKLSAVDIYMFQTDRRFKNITLELDRENNLRLSKGYDYEFGFNSPLKYDNFFYCNPYLRVVHNEEGLTKMIDAYPEFKEYFDILLKVDIQEIKDYIESNYPIVMERDSIINRESALKKHDVLQKVIKR